MRHYDMPFTVHYLQLTSNVLLHIFTLVI